MAGHGPLTALAGRGLRAFYVWTPVLEPDGRDAAVRASTVREHASAEHYWDAGARFARHMAGPLGLTPEETPSPLSPDAVAWDVYLLYPPGPRDLYAPAHWSHQLPTTKAPRLEAASFRQAVEALLPREPRGEGHRP